MQRTGLVMACLVLLLPLAAAQAPAYSITLQCGTDECPVPIVDSQDMLGDPVLISDGVHFVLGSLHGTAGGQDAATPKSRDGQAFTTMTSVDGAGWVDNPHFMPPGFPYPWLGEHHVVAFGGDGSLFAAYQMSKPGPGEGHSHGFAMYRYDGVLDMQALMGQAPVSNPWYADNGTSVGQFWLAPTHVPTVVWHEAKTPASDGRGDQIAFVQPDVGPPLTVSAPQYLGPCTSSTNPAVWGGAVYVGCRAGKGLAGVPEGDLGVYRLDEEAVLLGVAKGLPGGARLAIRDDGRMALAAADVVSGHLALAAAYATIGDAIVWSDPQPLSSAVPALEGERIEVNVQDMVFRADSGALHMIIKEVFDRPGPTESIQPAIQKALVVVHERHGALGSVRFAMGALADRLDNPEILAANEMAFNDIRDTILLRPDGTQYVAVGDYGRIQFAQVIETTDLEAEPVTPMREEPSTPEPPVDAEVPGPAIVVLLVGLLWMARRR